MCVRVGVWGGWRRTLTMPEGSWHAEAIAKHEQPPPLGSTATTKCRVLPRPIGPRIMSIGTSSRGRFKKASMSRELNALSELSAPMPMDSRKIIAGSSSSKLFTISILADDSQRGISCILCVHFSGVSVFKQSSAHTRTCVRRWKGQRLLPKRTAHERDRYALKQWFSSFILHRKHLAYAPTTAA